jgi:hypothetical protein
VAADAERVVAAWPPSVFFSGGQSHALVAEAQRLFGAFAQDDFLAWFDDETVVGELAALRKILDLLLFNAIPSIEDRFGHEDQRVAASRAADVSETEHGFVIGVSPVMQLIGEVAHQLELTYRASPLGPVMAQDDGIAALDGAVATWLACCVSGRRVCQIEGLAPPPDGPEEYAVRYHDMVEMAYVFAVAHELAHIESRHLVDEHSVLGAPWLRDLPAALRYEVEADCSTVTAMFNYYITREALNRRFLGSSPLIDLHQRHGLGTDERAVQGFIVVMAARRARSVIESFYTVMLIAGAVRTRLGDAPARERARTMELRREYVRRYLEFSAEELGRGWDLQLWQETDETDRRAQDLYLRHALGTVVPRATSLMEHPPLTSPADDTGVG